MNKNEYLSRLKKALKGVDFEDAEKLVDYYRELIEDALENGSGEEFINGLEPPELVAQNFIRELNSTQSKEETITIKQDKPLNDTKPKVGKTKNNTSNDNTSATIIKIVLMVICVMFAFAGAILIGVVSIVGISFLLKGFWAFITSFLIIGSHVSVAFAQIGYGIAYIAIGLFILFMIPIIAKLYQYVINLLSQKNQNKELNISFKKKTGITFGCIFALGVIIFLISFASIGFNTERLLCLDDLELKEQYIDIVDNRLTFNSDTLGLEIKYYDQEKIKLEYYEFKDEPKEYTADNGAVTLNNDLSLLHNCQVSFRRGIFFQNYSNNKYYKATLYLPQENDIDLNLNIKNGAISIQDMNFSNLSMSTQNGAILISNISAGNVNLSTKNGAVKINKCNLNNLNLKANNGAIKIEDTSIKNSIISDTQNGAIKMENVSAASIKVTSNNGAIDLDYCKADDIYGETHNGAIKVTSIVSDKIELHASNGAIKGTIKGSKSDYKIDSKTNNGSCNLNNKFDGTKTLIVHTSNGSINITFID